ncbi:MAG: ABC transporter permease [Armatimonadetes bacterium]|nr:ABC transporter permease [Armatimonadota bacterium]
MNAVWIIAAGTFGEAMRRKILNVFLFVALALIVMGFAFASFSPRQEIVLIKSMGLGVIGLAGVFISVILGINLIPNEIERRTIYTILSKPVQRYQFLCGKFLGGLMTVLSNIGLMGVLFVLLLTWKLSQFHDPFLGTDRDILKGVLMIFFQLTLVSAVALFFSVFLSPFVNFFLTFAVYLLGATGILESLGTPGEDKNRLTVQFFQLLHRIVPNFDNFNIQNPIIHPDVHIINETVYIWQNIAYALVYTAILLTLAVLIFDRREV